VDSIESIRQIHFDEVYWTMLSICMMDLMEDSVECTAELHRFRRSDGDCVAVDVIKAVVDDSTRSSVTLWYHPHR
jgi:hypothetical protein